VWDALPSPLDWDGAEARRLVEEGLAKLLLKADALEDPRADTT
jgi:hypothetical protein